MIVIILLIVLGSLAVYFGVGFAACKYTVPRAIEREYQERNRKNPNNTDQWRREFAVEFGGGPWEHGTIWGWWIAIPWTFILERNLFATEAYAPWAKESEIAAREDRLAQREAEIAKLERELGVGDQS